MEAFRKVIFDDVYLTSLLTQIEFYVERQMGGNDKFIDSVHITKEGFEFQATIIELLEDNEVKDLASRL